MKIKEALNQVGVKVCVVADNKEISSTTLVEFPYFYAKKYQLWHCFEYTNEERTAIEKMSLQEAFAQGNKELKLKLNHEKTKSENSVS